MIRRREHAQAERRAGTGRQTSTRYLGIIGRKTGVQLTQSSNLDAFGFNAIDDAWGNEANSDAENMISQTQAKTPTQLQSSLFPPSPSLAGSPHPKRLDFEKEQENTEIIEHEVVDTDDDDDDDDDDDGEANHHVLVAANQSTLKPSRLSHPPQSSSANALPTVSKAYRSRSSSTRKTLRSRRSKEVSSDEEEQEVTDDDDEFDDDDDDDNAVDNDRILSKPALHNVSNTAQKHTLNNSDDSVNDYEYKQKKKHNVKSAQSMNNSRRESEIELKSTSISEQSDFNKSRNQPRKRQSVSKSTESLKQLQQEIVSDLSDDEKDNQSMHDKDTLAVQTHVQSDTKKVKAIRKAKRSKAVKASTAKQKRAPRRQTLQLVLKAKETGMFNDENDTEGGTLRRSYRHRCKPLKFYRGEQLNYTLNASGLQVVDRAHPIVNVASSPSPLATRSKPKRVRTANYKSKALLGDDDQDLFASTTQHNEVVFDGVGSCFDQHTKQNVDGCLLVARPTLSMLNPIVSVASSADKRLNHKQLPMAAKLLQRNDVTSGLLRLPPSTIKSKEKAVHTEVFYVAAAEANCLAVTIHCKEFKLCKGDTFVVPSNNSYSIRNTSTHYHSTLHFTIVSATSDHETQQITSRKKRTKSAE